MSPGEYVPYRAFLLQVPAANSPFPNIALNLYRASRSVPGRGDIPILPGAFAQANTLPQCEHKAIPAHHLRLEKRYVHKCKLVGCVYTYLGLEKRYVYKCQLPKCVYTYLGLKTR